MPIIGAVAITLLGRGTILSLAPTGNPVATIATVLSGVYLVLQASKHIGRQPVLAYVGRNSLTVVALHFLAFKLVSLVLVEAQHLPRYEIADSRSQQRRVRGGSRTLSSDSWCRSV